MPASAAVYARPQRAPRSSERRNPSMQVIPGHGRRVAPLAAPLVTVAKIVAVAFVLFAVLCFARVALNSATLSTEIASQELSLSISEARVSGSSLEVEQATLVNMTRLRSEANSLSMVDPDEVESIHLPIDVVATDAQGNLSFSLSAQNAALAVAGV